MASLCLVCVASLITADSQLCSFISSASLTISDSEVRQQEGLVLTQHPLRHTHTCTQTHKHAHALMNAQVFSHVVLFSTHAQSLTHECIGTRRSSQPSKCVHKLLCTHIGSETQPLALLLNMWVRSRQRCIDFFGPVCLTVCCHVKKLAANRTASKHN